MRRDGSGRWRCPDCYKPGDDPVSLQRANAAGVQRPRGRRAVGPPPDNYTYGPVETTLVDPYTAFGSSYVLWARADRASLANGDIVTAVADPYSNSGYMVPTAGVSTQEFDLDLSAPIVRLHSKGKLGFTSLPLGSVTYPLLYWVVAKFYTVVAFNNILEWFGGSNILYRQNLTIGQYAGSFVNTTPFELFQWNVIVAYFQGASGIGPSDFVEVNGVRASGASAGSNSLSVLFPFAATNGINGPPDRAEPFWDMAECGMATGSSNTEAQLLELKTYLTAHYEGLTL